MHQGIPEVQVELPEWRLYLAFLKKRPGADPGPVDQLLAAAIAETKRRLAETPVAEDPMVQATRRAFRRSGGDPGRYRPAYEALARRLLKAGDLPRILPFVDLNNALSLVCRVACCVGSFDALEPPLILRRGTVEDEFTTMRGTFSGADKPVLCDARGIVGTPIVDSERVLIRTDTEDVLLWAYVPSDVPSDPAAALRTALDRCGLATLIADGWS